MIHSRVSWMFLPVDRSITVSAPQRIAQRHLLDLLVDRRGDRRVADVGVDLHQEVAADDHRLDLRVVDVGRDDRAAARHLVAHELGRDDLRQIAAPNALARVLPPQQLRQRCAGSSRALVLADRDELHLRRDDALARVVHLRHVASRRRAARRALQVEAQLGELRDRPAARCRTRKSARRARSVSSALRDPRLRAGGAGRSGCRSSPPGRCTGRSVVDQDRRIACRSARSRASARAAAPTWTLRDPGNGCTAASSTCACAARNLGLAFIALPSAELPASGSKGLSHPAREATLPCAGPPRG